MSIVSVGNGNIVAGGSIVINGNCCSAGANGVIGNGKVKAERRQVDRINSVLLDGPISLLFTRGGAQTVRVIADENILPIITTNVAGSTLHIGCSGGFSTSNEILVEVEMPSLVSLKMRGSGNVEINQIEQPFLHIDLSGSGTIEVAGKVDHFTADLNGSGDIDAASLESKSIVLSLKGSGDIHAQASESVKARLDGSGDIKIAGQPAIQDCTASGSGRIQRIR